MGIFILIGFIGGWELTDLSYRFFCNACNKNYDKHYTCNPRPNYLWIEKSGHYFGVSFYDKDEDLVIDTVYDMPYISIADMGSLTRQAQRYYTYKY